MYDPAKQSRRPYEAAGMAIAPPPPIPPPTPAATLQPPPNEFGEPAEMDLKREMLGMVQQPTQAQVPLAGALPQNTTAAPAQSALTPNVPPPPAPAGPQTPDGRAIPQGSSFDAGSNMIVPGGGVRTAAFDQQHNPAIYAQQAELERRIRENDPTLQGTDAWQAANPGQWDRILPPMSWGDADQYYAAHEGANGPDGGANYGSGPDSRGYIRTEADPFGEDAAEQQRIQDELRASIDNGQGTGGTHEVDFSGGTLDPYRGDDSVFAPPVTDGTGGVPPQPGDDDEATDDELRALIRDRANRESDFDSDFMDPSQMFEQGADALEARLERGRTDSTRRIREVMASRGVNEGSPEYGELANLEGELGVQRQEGLSQLNRERYGFSLDARAQELQKYGIDTSLSYQYASLEQDAGFRGRALDLQKSGMDMDEAYRYAAMAQDSGFRQQVLDLQREGMSLDDAYRKAALAQDKEQYGTQSDIQKAGLDLERQRMVSQIQSMLYDNEIEWKDVPTWIRDILVPDWRSSRP